MRFGRLPPDDSLSSKALLVEHKLLEDKLAMMNRIIEEDRLKAQMRQQQNAKQKAFSIRNLRRQSKQKDQSDSTQTSNPQLKPVFVKKGIRAYEEVVKNKLQSKKQGNEEQQERKNAELVSFLDSIKLGKLLDTFKKGGVTCVEDLKTADLKKFNLLPGFELKLLKKLNEAPPQLSLKREALLPPPGSRESAREKQPLRATQEAICRSNKENQQISDDEDYLVKKKPLPPALPKARKYHTIVTRLKSLHEESTMSEVRKAQTADTGCGPEPLPLKVGCWFCASVLGPDQPPVVHPIFVEKVVLAHRDFLFSGLHEVRVQIRDGAVRYLPQDNNKAWRNPQQLAVVLLAGLLRQTAA